MKTNSLMVKNLDQLIKQIDRHYLPRAHRTSSATLMEMVDKCTRTLFDALPAGPMDINTFYNLQFLMAFMQETAGRRTLLTHRNSAEIADRTLRRARKTIQGIADAIRESVSNEEEECATCQDREVCGTPPVPQPYPNNVSRYVH